MDSLIMKLKDGKAASKSLGIFSKEKAIGEINAVSGE